MKKYAYIILTTVITLSTTCMEKEREHKKADPLNIQSSSIALPANSSLYSMSTLNGLLQPQPLLTTHTIHKQYQFSDVGFDYVPVYVPVTTNEASNTDDIQLTPIYRPIAGSITECFDYINKKNVSSPQQDQKPIDTYLIERLHSAARDCLDALDGAASEKPYNKKDFRLSPPLTISLNGTTWDKKLITTIKLMNKAKHNGITEDYMGNFSYEKYCKLTHPYAADGFTPLVFSCLKRYMLTITQSQEKLILDATDLSYPHPAYDNLIKNIKSMFTHSQYIIIPYLYASSKILSEKEQYNHISTLDKFCEALYDQLSLTNTTWEKRLCNRLSLIEQITTIKNIQRTKDLGNAILAFKRQQTFKEKLFRYPERDYDIDSKNYLAMFCIYAEKYLQTRNNKITPSLMQFYIWAIKWNTNIALPDSFDTTLLNTNDYALKEFDQLYKDIYALSKKNDAEIQNLIDQHYIFDEQ